jgi:hypothetical protein
MTMRPRRPPTLTELDFGARAQVGCATKTDHAELFAEFADQLLAPFSELQRDLALLGDKRLADYLDDLIRTAQGQT